MAILDVIEWADAGARDIVQRVPARGSGEFRIGSQLVVREHQAAVFFRDGKALDTFGPGRYTLTTANIPFLTELISIPFGGKSPFRAEVYFTNSRTFTEMKWGTPEPIALRDKDLGMVRLRAFGNYAMQVTDPQLFVNKIVGARGLYETSDIRDFLRGIIVSRFTDFLGEAGVSLFDLPRMYDELGAGARARASDDFKALGLDLKAFYVQSVNTTEETQKAIDERAAMGAVGDMQSYVQFKTARALSEAATAGGEGAAQTGLGLGAGVGLGAIMAQMMGRAMAQPPQGEQPAPAGPENLNQVFTAMQLLVQGQLTLDQKERDQIIAQLQNLYLELAKEKPSLSRIKEFRATITGQWPWVSEELAEAFGTPAVQKAMAAAAAAFTEG
ncbi:MAG: SPFH domain-containing protein, partial [Anaerolineae bacterium]